MTERISDDPEYGTVSCEVCGTVWDVEIQEYCPICVTIPHMRKVIDEQNLEIQGLCDFIFRDDAFLTHDDNGGQDNAAT